MDPDPHDIPGFNRASGVDDPVPDAEYGDDREAVRRAAEEAIDECPVCGEPIPEPSRKELNLGLPEYCSLACRFEGEGEQEGRDR